MLNQVEEKIMEDDSFLKLYDFYRLVRVKEEKDRLVRYKERKVDRRKWKLRYPLDIGEKVLVFAERLKKDAPGNLYKRTTENIQFLNRDRVFTISKRVLVDNENNCY